MQVFLSPGGRYYLTLCTRHQKWQLSVFCISFETSIFISVCTCVNANVYPIALERKTQTNRSKQSLLQDTECEVVHIMLSCFNRETGAQMPRTT